MNTVSLTKDRITVDGEPFVRVGHWADNAQGNTLPRYYWWGDNDAPVGGDTVYFGYSGMYREPGTDLFTAPEYVEVPATMWGDYVGGAVYRSNARSLTSDFEDTFVTVSGDFSSETLMLPANAYIPEHLANALTALADDYPVYDESDWSELEMEIITESWDNYGRDDFRNALGRKFTEVRDYIDDELYSLVWDLKPDTLDDLFYRYMSNGNGDEAEVETADSAYFRDDELVEWFARFIRYTRKGNRIESDQDRWWEQQV